MSSIIRVLKILIYSINNSSWSVRAIQLQNSQVGRRRQHVRPLRNKMGGFFWLNDRICKVRPGLLQAYNKQLFYALEVHNLYMNSFHTVLVCV